MPAGARHRPKDSKLGFKPGIFLLRHIVGSGQPA